MKHTYRKRITGLVCAAAVLCSSTAGIAPAFPAAAYAPLTNLSSETDTALTPVIITLDGSTALDCAEDPENLGSAAAQSASDRAERQQARVIRKLQEKYPALETDEQLTTLVNSFSCTLPKNLIPYAESLDGVTGVTRNPVIEIKPDMAEAAELGDIPAYYDETSCTGEGQVIAVIDTELNLDHPMFAPLPDDVEVKLTKEDVDEIAATVGFNCAESWSNGYRSTKVPFACNYQGNDSLSVPNDSASNYHGSHVAGIAAGNPVETEDGRMISGVAPNAQIVFMVVNGRMSLAAFISAIEDAVKLKADAINISFGIDAEAFDFYQPLNDAVNAAEAAGITVCIAAGNADNGSEYFSDLTDPENPDRSIMNGFITEGEKALAVASADNTYTMQMHTLSHNGTLMAYTGCTSDEYAEVQYLGDVLGTAEYAYEYCGLGYPEDFAGKDLTGKLALVDRGVLDFTVKADNAKAAGAVGVIVIQNAPFDYNMTMLNTSDLLLAMISQEDGAALKDAEVKTISFSDETISNTLPTKVSDYTSWGVHNSLELRPDIMGIGANVESASYTGDNTALMSGTSMASPYIAGCAALLNEYLDKNGCTLTGSERQQFIRNLLMTSAAPYSEDGVFVTPRRQGAGLVSVNRAVHDKVLLTGAEGESKLNLRDELGSQFSFPVTVTNISNEDVTFSSARIELTTDGTEYDAGSEKYLLTTGQQALSCSADLGDLATIAAGDSKTVTVTVTLDAAQAASLDAIFTNGYFIEGYLLLEGAENCSDISVPLLGFSKSFAALPLFTDSCKTVVGNYPYSGLIYSPSYFDLTKRKMEIEWPELKGTGAVTITGENVEMGSQEYWDIEEKIRKLQDSLTNFDDTIIVSPNHDHAADSPGFIVRVRHDCVVSGAELYDKDGNLAAIGCEAIPFARNMVDEYGTAFYQNQLIYDLPEGEYTMRLNAAMTKEALQTHPNILETKVIIDNTDPDLKTELTEKNGRKILKLTAKDDHLDTLVVLGDGSGAPVNASAYERICYDGRASVSDFLAFKSAAFDEEASYLRDMWWLRLDGLITEDIINDDPLYREKVRKESPLIRSFDNSLSEDWLTFFDFSDIIKAEPDQNGVFTIEYDVTDMDAYHFVILDNALNSDYVEYFGEKYIPKSVPSGIYRSEHGLYEITEDTLRFYPFAYGVKPTTYHYHFERQLSLCFLLVLEGDFDDSMDKDGSCFSWEFPSETELILHGTSEGSGFLKGFGFPDTVDEHLELTDLTSAEDYFAIDTYTLENDYLIPFVKEYAARGAVRITDYEIAPDAVVTYGFIGHDIGGGHAVNMDITVDLKTGIATLPDGSTVDILKTELLRPGDLNEDSTVDVADAVMLARMLAEDAEVAVTEQGRKNADCNRNGQPDQQDVVLILRAIARLVEL